jgi:hypothetical protein
MKQIIITEILLISRTDLYYSSRYTSTLLQIHALLILLMFLLITAEYLAE